MSSKARVVITAIAAGDRAANRALYIVTITRLRHQSHPDRTRRHPHRVRRDHVDSTGKIAMRVAGRLHHIGIGRTHARTHIVLLVDGLHVRVIDAAVGELLRDLTIDTTRDYQPTGAPKGPTRTDKKRPEPS